VLPVLIFTLVALLTGCRRTGPGKTGKAGLSAENVKLTARMPGELDLLNRVLGPGLRRIHAAHTL
jgi:hypothetical protein